MGDIECPLPKRAQLRAARSQETRGEEEAETSALPLDRAASGVGEGESVEAAASGSERGEEATPALGQARESVDRAADRAEDSAPSCGEDDPGAAEDGDASSPDWPAPPSPYP